MTVPEGCVGLEFPDGSKPDAARTGGHVEVDSRQEHAIRKGWYGQHGVISGTLYSFGT